MIIFLLTIFHIRYVIKFLHSAAAWRYTFTKNLHEHIVSIPAQGFSERVVSVHYICLYCIPTAKNLLNFFFTVNNTAKNHFLISRNRKSKHFLKWKDKNKQYCTTARLTILRKIIGSGSISQQPIWQVLPAFLILEFLDLQYFTVYRLSHMHILPWYVYSKLTWQFLSENLMFGPM